METFFLSSVPTFAVIAGEKSHAAFAGKEWFLPVPQSLAEELLDKLVRMDFDMAYSQDAELGHAYAANPHKLWVSVNDEANSFVSAVLAGRVPALSRFTVTTVGNQSSFAYCSSARM